jgi:predicted component of type VI protein secretion system
MWKFLTNSTPAGTPLPSSGGQYVAVVGPPQEVWGNYLAGLALWEAGRPPRLLYYRAGHSARALAVHPADQPTFLYWSLAGDWLTFYEFKRQQTYEVVFIHTATGQAYRVLATDALLAQLPALSQKGAQIEAFLQQADHSVGPLVQDEASAELRPR